MELFKPGFTAQDQLKYDLRRVVFFPRDILIPMIVAVVSCVSIF